MQGFSSLLLESTDGELILQHRDNNPAIINPGKISFFGGHMEPDEEPEVAAIREIEEELTLKINKDQLLPLFTVSDHHNDCLIHVYLVKDVDKSKLELREGQGIIYLPKSNVIDSSNFSDVAKFCISRYWGLTI